ncbi:hypothetical protein B0H14DRAFT_3448994 [Mycena olivaceomarginata]|nr:hypothetical protein B0H14DRAFT_3448994 [Mycena olivaceomarginata]
MAVTRALASKQDCSSASILTLASKQDRPQFLVLETAVFRDLGAAPGLDLDGIGLERTERPHVYLVVSPLLPVVTIAPPGAHPAAMHVPPAPKAHHARFRIMLPYLSHSAAISLAAPPTHYAMHVSRRSTSGPSPACLSCDRSLAAPPPVLLVCARPPTPQPPSHGAMHTRPTRCPSVLAISPRCHLHTTH